MVSHKDKKCLIKTKAKWKERYIIEYYLRKMQNENALCAYFF